MFTKLCPNRFFGRHLLTNHLLHAHAWGCGSWNSVKDQSEEGISGDMKCLPAYERKLQRQHFRAFERSRGFPKCIMSSCVICFKAGPGPCTVDDPNLHLLDAGGLPKKNPWEINHNIIAICNSCIFLKDIHLLNCIKTCTF